MKYLFRGCKSLTSLPDLSKWNTNNVINIEYLFSYYEYLSSLPDILNWNTYNIK